jgi:hypothetical protein
LTQIPPHATPAQVGICSVKQYARVRAIAIIRIRPIRFGRCCCELAAAKLTPSGAAGEKEFSEIDGSSLSLAYPPVLSCNRLTLSVIYYEWLLMRQTAVDAARCGSSATKLDSNAISISSPTSAARPKNQQPQLAPAYELTFSQQPSTKKWWKRPNDAGERCARG